MSRTPTDFWSSRKAGVRAELAEQNELIAERAHAQEMAEREAKSDEAILEELGLPKPEAMKAGDNFAGFMSKSVPERLRRRALRNLWGSNATLANLDGLIEYGEDYTDANTVIENMQTAYQVGKGMMHHINVMLEEAEAQDAEEPQDVAAVRPPEEVPDLEPAPEAEYEFSELEDQEPAPTRRRMRFEPIPRDGGEA
ncbi:DUF3306 domain-containing protein [Falsihalocynthiibacter sp. SS001]|uniref:DUF3306 domain-containing protein n=1 Tax=Falsihalocynthiibacter sp. SS001 TaxID=3349698 RepID=UPI0036D35801